MAQTRYNRPWPLWVPVVIFLPFTCALVGIAIVYGVQRPHVWIAIAVETLALLLMTALDPETTIESKGMLDDGTPVRVRRPLVGFKRLERKVGVTGGYEVRFDGYRYEEAYIRL